ncbi:hypothetical protein C7S18_20810 [Ahniella affigens]|uniref:Uncharacterized protein n=1 Tax=Ahniella affigens TaxID=2021234 RepID=A0A2P1PXA9_9GAMM|nr:hypothetical protein C7S18_20810 [Ahniella affigens]
MLSAQREVWVWPANEGLNRSILDFQICNESGACPGSLPRVAFELVQRLPNPFAERLQTERH